MNENIPENLIDLITYEIYEDPVIAEDGFVYSRVGIIDWFEGCEELNESITSPLTSRPIGTTLKSDAHIAKAVEMYKNKSVRTQRFNESTQTISTLTRIYEIIDPMKELFASKNWQAPALVVMGNENSGKSTLLERLAMMPIFPKDKFICTRMAIRVHLRRGPIMAPRLDVFDNETATVMWSKVIPMERGREFVKEAMEAVLKQEFGELTGVSKSKMLIIHITGPHCPDLDMVDLPGLVSTHVRGEPEDMKDQTAELVEAYVKENNAHSLYLVALSATSASNQSLAFDIVQKLGLHNKSIGVFTKSDKCDLKDESDGLGGLQNLRMKVLQQSRDIVPLEKWGYVCSMNKPCDDKKLTNYAALIKQSTDETSFFQTRGMGDLINNQLAGCKALLHKVSTMFHEYLRSTWAPNTIILLREETSEYRTKERNLGIPRADVFRQSHQMKTDGIDAIYTVEEITQYAINRAIDLTSLACNDAVDIYSSEILKKLYEACCTETCAVSGKPSEVLAHQLEMQVKLKYHVTIALNEIEKIIKEQVINCLEEDDSNFKLGRFASFIDAVSSNFAVQIKPWRQKTEELLLQHINRSFESPLVNPFFKLVYIFEKDEDGEIYPNVEMDFDGQPLAASLLNSLIVRCSSLVEEVCSPKELDKLAKKVNWTESCASERTFLLKALHNVDSVIFQLMQYLNLTEEDIAIFYETGELPPPNPNDRKNHRSHSAHSTNHHVEKLNSSKHGKHTGSLHDTSNDYTNHYNNNISLSAHGSMHETDNGSNSRAASSHGFNGSSHGSRKSNSNSNNRTSYDIPKGLQSR